MTPPFNESFLPASRSLNGKDMGKAAAIFYFAAALVMFQPRFFRDFSSVASDYWL
jgi:hypothetical protein